MRSRHALVVDTEADGLFVQKGALWLNTFLRDNHLRESELRRSQFGRSERDCA
jgi:hypothetical protein